MVFLGLSIVPMLVCASLFAPHFSPYDPVIMRVDGVYASLSREHFLGTDELGRDVLSRIIFGTRLGHRQFLNLSF